ncbi:MAG: LiaF transmembrane domain-containing protein [Clostridium sp.]
MKMGRVFWGSLLLLSGIALIISKMGFLPEINVFNLVLGVFLLVIMIKSAFSVNFTGILFPLAFICILYDEKLGLTDITPWPVLFAALLGSIGLSLIFNKKPKRFEKYIYDNSTFKVEDFEMEDEGHFRFRTSFGDSIKYINSPCFEQANLQCEFGAMKVYFDNTTLLNGKGIIKIDSSFAGMELYIPKEWKVIDNTKVVFGGVEEKNRNVGSSNNILTLVGKVSFAGVEIIYI